MRYSAILFDLDGTLVDTITLYGEAVLGSLKEIGIEATMDQYREWYHAPLHLSGILALYGMTEKDAPTIRQRRDEMYVELLRKKTEWLPGARELLETLASATPVPLAPSAPLAIVTGSWMTYVDAIDSRLGVKKYFDVFVTVDDMGKFTKPHPHGLLLACDRLGVKPEDCLYIGDQRFDAEASAAAGMDCLLVKGTWSPEDLACPPKSADGRRRGKSPCIACLPAEALSTITEYL